MGSMVSCICRVNAHLISNWPGRFSVCCDYLWCSSRLDSSGTVWYGVFDHNLNLYICDAWLKVLVVNRICMKPKEVNLTSPCLVVDQLPFGELSEQIKVNSLQLCGKSDAYMDLDSWFILYEGKLSVTSFTFGFPNFTFNNYNMYSVNIQHRNYNKCKVTL